MSLKRCSGRGSASGKQGRARASQSQAENADTRALLTTHLTQGALDAERATEPGALRPLKRVTSCSPRRKLLGYYISAPIMENLMEKNMENEMETGEYRDSRDLLLEAASKRDLPNPSITQPTLHLQKPRNPPKQIPHAHGWLSKLWSLFGSLL